MLGTFLQYFWPYFLAILPGSPFRSARCWLWRLMGYNVSPEANIMAGCSLRYGDITIGSRTFVGEGTLITGGTVSIGAECDIAPRCVIHAGSHSIGSSSRRAGPSFAGSISIGAGTWVGTASTILAGAEIGSGVVIAAGSVVTKGVYPDNVLIGGVPARTIKLLDD